MTNGEAAAILESEAEFLYAQDEPYNRQAFYMAIEALRNQERTCGKCACYDRQFSYCNKLGVTFSDYDFCICFEQKEETENDGRRRNDNI